MTISQYRGMPALPGVVLDRASARGIYAGLGFDGPLRELADAELDLAGMRAALARLVQETQPGDRVFLYFSGHGSSRSNAGQCEQALLAQDAQPLVAAEFARSLQALNDKAGQVVMVVDACHSGGVARSAALRSVPGMTTQLTPKFAPLPDACAQPSNLFADAVPARRRGAVNLERNHVFLAAAREDEVAFDEASRGGIATQALLQCLVPTARPAGTAASFEDWRACAQQQVARSLPDDPRIGMQHLVLQGNEAMALRPAALQPAAAAAETPAAALRRLAAAADTDWRVGAVATPNALQIGRDRLSLAVTSARDGYLSIVYAGSDGRSLSVIYPARPGDPQALRAGSRFEVPRTWRSQGPAGTDQLLLLVSDTPVAAGEWLARLGVAGQGGAACLRNLASDDCTLAAAAAGSTAAAARFGFRPRRGWFAPRDRP